MIRIDGNSRTGKITAEIHGYQTNIKSEFILLVKKLDELLGQNEVDDLISTSRLIREEADQKTEKDIERICSPLPKELKEEILKSFRESIRERQDINSDISANTPLYNGKFVVTEKEFAKIPFTVGNVYEVKDGILTDDIGVSFHLFESFDEIKQHLDEDYYTKILEIKE